MCNPQSYLEPYRFHHYLHMVYLLSWRPGLIGGLLAIIETWRVLDFPQLLEVKASGTI